MELRYAKKLLIIIFIFFSFIYSNRQAFAIQEIKLDKNSTVDEQKLISDISLEKIIKLATEHSYDLKLADFNQLLARQDVRLARSEYFPKLNVMIGTEYTYNFKNYRNSIVTTVGDAFINPYTRFQSILGLNLSYNLFDFGVRKNKLNASKEEVVAKNIEVKRQKEELDLTMVDLYTKILTYKKQIDLNKQILTILKDSSNINKRLYKAKEISKTQLNDSEVEIEKVNKRITELKQALGEELNWLGFYTGESFNIEKLKPEEIKNVEFDYLHFNDYTKTTTWQIYEAQLKEKEYLYKAAKRNYLPKVNAYTRYYLYGSDYSNWPQAWGDLGPSSFTVGVTAGMPVFDGFVNAANVEKARLEFEQLQIERDKAIAQWTMRLATLRSNLSYLKEQINENKKIINQLDEKEKSTKRLLQKRLISPVEYNDARVKLLEEQIELVKNQTTSTSLIKAIEILTKE